ncbi:heat shock protein 68-like [Histomonas meleagridis]|uniref:heat shock protein 68-like n=1 Tax=Histomonas meleagridis TaxID=135588 RepID=UPI003559CE64|nr:heat shock protein 68-like [Histomonas meleagridis]KAH0801726.1 heat shock protein 68-like [Histomonas meleagridis]
MKRSKKKVIAIDLGSKYCCVGITRNGEIEVINDYSGSPTISAMVSFSNENEILIGVCAEDFLLLNPESTVYDFQIMIGRKFDDPVIQDHINKWPFKVIRSAENTPLIEIELDHKKKFYSPIDISSFLIKYLKVLVEEYLADTVMGAVITVPFSFNSIQRESIKEAAKIAGLDFVSIIDEPIAAAIAYYPIDTLENKKNVLLFDFGNTLKVSILKVKQNKIKICAAVEDVSIGCQSLTDNIVEYLLDCIQDRFGLDIRNNRRSMCILERQSSKLKVILSKLKKAMISIPALYNDTNFLQRIDRIKFENINSKIFLNILRPIKDVLKKADMIKADIDDVILAGGSSNIPIVKEILQGFFGEKIFCNVNPESVFVTGAAKYANNMSKSQNN